MAFPLVGLVIATILLIVYLTKRNKRTDGLKEIPGPMRIPIVGNIFQLGKRPYKQFWKWSEEYGNIYKVHIGNTTAIVLSDPKWARELFASDHVYTGKPRFEGFGMYLEDPMLGMFGSEGEPWEVHRRFLLRQLRDFGFGKSSMESLIMDEVNEVLDNFKKKAGAPVGNIRNTLRLAVVNSLWSILSSERFKHDDPALLRLALNTSDTFNEIIEGGGLLIFLPWLRHIIPKWSGFTAIREVLEENKTFFEKSIEKHKANFKEDDLRDYMDVYLAEIKKTTDPNSPFYGKKAEQFLAAELFDLFLAGSDSTSTTISWTVLYLCTFPEVQKKMQKEIDEAVGNSRRVSVDDRPNLPYTLALIDEVLRFSSLVPDGVQHRVMADREFKGFHIPKDAWIQPNLYYIHHNPKIWGDPQNFRPERFLSSDGKKYVRNDNVQAFQTGKRACVGEPLARDTLLLYISNIFQQFSIEFDPNTKSRTLESKPGFLSCPVEYTVIMKERFKK